MKVGLYGDVVPEEEDNVFTWRLYCMDKKTGKKLWDQTAHEGKPKIKRHPKSSHANSTPCTNGERVVALMGSEGLYCYDMTGKLLWTKGSWPSGLGLLPLPLRPVGWRELARDP